MTDSLLDEDGRCRKTDFFPYECACIHHRGGSSIEDLELEQIVAIELSDVYIAHVMRSKFDNGQCRNCRADIRQNQKIHLLKSTKTDEEVGWVCTPCADQVNM